MIKLVNLYDKKVDEERLEYENQIKSQIDNTLHKIYDKINNLVSGGYFGGFRGGFLGSASSIEATNLPMIPSQEIADNLKQAFA